jgi:hypothetical protein
VVPVLEGIPWFRQPIAGRQVHRFLGSTPIGLNLDVYAVARNLPRLSGDFACEAIISLANWKISLAKRFCFAERRARRKLLKSLESEKSNFAVSRDFKSL